MTFEAETPVAPETTADGLSSASDTVTAADLLTPEAKGASEQSEAPAQTDAPKQEQKAERMFTSSEMSDTVEKRLRQERKKAAYTLGNALLSERMKAENIDEAEAYKRIMDDRRKAKAAEYRENPEKAFNELLRMNEERQQPEEQRTRTSEATADQYFQTIIDGISSGIVPKEFDVKGYMSDRERGSAFLDMIDAFGLERACKMAMSMSAPMQKGPSKTERNRELPQPINTNNSSEPRQVDFKSMSSDQFAEYKRRMKEAAAAGKKVQW